MRFYFTLFIGILLLGSCAVSNNPQRKEIKLLQRGSLKTIPVLYTSFPMKQVKPICWCRVISAGTHIRTGLPLILK